MSENTKENNGLTLPLVPLRDIVVYPKMTVNLDIGRKDSADAVRLASRGDRYDLPEAIRGVVDFHRLAREKYGLPVDVAAMGF